jgi:hypothetical protein
MKKDSRLNVTLGAFLLMLLAVLTLLAVRNGRMPDEKAVVKVEDNVVHDSYSQVAVVAVVALFAYVMWTILRANRGEAKAVPPAKESSPSDNTAPR